MYGGCLLCLLYPLLASYITPTIQFWGLSKWVISENRLYPANRPETKQFYHRSNGTSPKQQETKIKSYVSTSTFNAMEKNAKISSHGNKEIEY